MVKLKWKCLYIILLSSEFKTYPLKISVYKKQICLHLQFGDSSVPAPQKKNLKTYAGFIS